MAKITLRQYGRVYIYVRQLANNFAYGATGDWQCQPKQEIKYMSGLTYPGYLVIVGQTAVIGIALVANSVPLGEVTRSSLALSALREFQFS